MKLLLGIVTSLLFLYCIIFFYFFYYPLKANGQNLINLKVAEIYHQLGEPSHNMMIKGIIAWENCSRFLCSNVEIRINTKNDFMNNYPELIHVSNVYNGKTKYFKISEITDRDSMKKYITLWPFNTFLLYKKEY